MDKKIFKILTISLIFSLFLGINAHAKAICKVAVFYKWKVDTSYKEENRGILKKNQIRQDKDKIKETFWGIIEAEGETKEDAQKSLDYSILEKQGDVLNLCKSEHESYSACISNKYKRLKADLDSSNFNVRKQIEDSIKQDCENQVGDCLEIVKRDVLCEEIKEEAPKEEEETDDKSKNNKKNKKDNAKKDKK